MQPVIRTLLILLLACGPITGSLAKPTNVTPEEIALTSTFCPDTEAYTGIYNRVGRTAQWETIMGPGFRHLHHYCWAQIGLLRANRIGIPREKRRFARTVAIGEYMYVINNVPHNFILLPEIYTKLGEAELYLDNPLKAHDAFAKARELKPDYWPAYARWVEYLIKTGRRDEAKALAKLGLEQAPNAKGLLEQYLRLGGKATDIEVKPEPTETPVAKE